MNPEAAPRLLDKDAPPTRASQSRLLHVGWVIVAVALLAIAVAVAFFSSTKSSVVWMTLEEFAESLRPGPFTSLKQKAINLTAPLWRRFRHSRSLVLIQSKVIAMPAEAANTLGLDPPIAINEYSLRAWTLSSTRFEMLSERLKKLPSAAVIPAHQVSSFARGWGLLSVGTTVLIRGKHPPATVKIVANAKPIRTSWRLTCSIKATAPITSTNTNIVELRTNFATVCQATIPVSGAIVIQVSNPAVARNTNYWVVLSLAPIDVQGKRTAN